MLHIRKFQYIQRIRGGLRKVGGEKIGSKGVAALSSML